jgi:hypothetical protein
LVGKALLATFIFNLIDTYCQTRGCVTLYNMFCGKDVWNIFFTSNALNYSSASPNNNTNPL